MPEMPDDFYVGYRPRSPRPLARRLRAVALALLLAAGFVALVLSTGQARFDSGTFEFGIDREFEGVVLEHPYPLLLVPASPRAGPGSAPFTTHLLVAFGKRGAGALFSGLDGRAVRVTGSLIFDERKRMIEVHEIESLNGATDERLQELARSPEHQLGTLTLTGEIVDAKCYLGAMKPGRGKAHKACAIRCISGGVPPVLRVEDPEGRVELLLLVSAAGEPVNREVLHLVAEPVEITGEVIRSADTLVLRADPSTYRRVGS